MKKEKLMPIKRQIVYIRKVLTNRGVSCRSGEIEDYVSPDLHYDENLSNCMKEFGISETPDYTEKESMTIQAEQRHAERSRRAQLQDYHKRAKTTYTIGQIINDPKKADRWFDKPNRYDIFGIDVKEGLAAPKTKRRRKRKSRR